MRVAAGSGRSKAPWSLERGVGMRASPITITITVAILVTGCWLHPARAQVAPNVPAFGAIDRTRPRGEGRARDPHRAGPSTVDGRHRATASRVASGYALPSRHAPGRSPTARCTSLVQRHRDQAGRGWRRGRTGSRREGNVTAPAVRRAVGHRREWPERRPGVQRHQPARSRFADVWHAAVRWDDHGRRAGDTADHYPRRVGSRRGRRLPIAAKRAVRLQ